MADHTKLENHLVALVGRQPWSTTRELLRRLRTNGTADAETRKRDLNRVLYGSSIFQNDGSCVPRWTVRGQPTRRLTADSAGRHRSRPAADTAETWSLSGLRAWQREALEAWFDADGRGIVEAVTGTGKTHVGLEAACWMAARGGRTTILVPSIELQRQWVDRLGEFAGHLTVAMDGGTPDRRHRSADVTVALVQSARRTDLTHGGGQFHDGERAAGALTVPSNPGRAGRNGRPQPLVRLHNKRCNGPVHLASRCPGTARILVWIRRKSATVPDGCRSGG
jgi:Type III restriction enzyme, res subunit